MGTNVIDCALAALASTELTPYRISIDTGLSQGIIGKWKKGITRPSKANAKLLLQYLSSQSNGVDMRIDEAHHNFNIKGNNNQVNASVIMSQALEEIAAQRSVTQKSQEQIDRLISLLEKINK